MTVSRSQKVQTISSSDEIRTITRKGKKIQTDWFRLAHQPKREVRARFAVIASRRLGNAVVRNRIKRRVREIMRRSVAFLSSGSDAVIIPQPTILNEKFDTLRLAVEKVLSTLSK